MEGRIYNYHEEHNTVPLTKLPEGNYIIELNDYTNDELPTVSIVTITYNRSYIFEIAIRNWIKTIYPSNKIEWIILDDSDKQSIKSMLPRDNRIKYFYLSTKIPTVSEKRNKANELANNQIICHMDDDDYYFPDAVLNRVKVLLHYNKQCVGSSRLNCINILDNTSLITGGGIIKYKNGNKSLVMAEASLCYYKTFWEVQKFNNETKNEEVIDLLMNRQDDCIDLAGSFVMVAITHSTNMSDRVLENTINRYNFMESLDAATVKFLEKLQSKVYLSIEDNKIALDVYKKLKDKGNDTIIKKINKLPINIQKTVVIQELRSKTRINRVVIPKTINILYFISTFNKNIKPVNFNYFNENELQLFRLAELLYEDNYEVNLYLHTDTETTYGPTKIFPYWKWNKNEPVETTIIYEEYTMFQVDINTKYLYYMTNNIVNLPDYVINKCDKIIVQSIYNKFVYLDNYVKDPTKIKIYPFLYLGSCKQNTSNNEIYNNDILLYNFSTLDSLSIICKKYDTVYINNKLKRELMDEYKNITYISDLSTINPTYIGIDVNNINTLYYCIYIGKKVISSQLIDITLLIHNIIEKDINISYNIFKNILSGGGGGGGEEYKVSTESDYNNIDP